MSFTQFDEPVRVLVGLGYQVTIENVAEAHAFLSEWPQSKRDAVHEIAMSACRSALARRAEPGTARAAFATFARRHCILMPQLTELVAAQAAGALPHRPAA